MYATPQSSSTATPAGPFAPVLAHPQSTFGTAILPADNMANAAVRVSITIPRHIQMTAGTRPYIVTGENAAQYLEELHSFLIISHSPRWNPG
jgi:hypothetical protein